MKRNDPPKLEDEFSKRHRLGGSDSPQNPWGRGRGNYVGRGRGEHTRGRGDHEVSEGPGNGAGRGDYEVRGRGNGEGRGDYEVRGRGNGEGRGEGGHGRGENSGGRGHGGRDRSSDSRGRGGGGRGRGRGEGGGGRGARRGHREEEFDLVVSRPRNDAGIVLKKQAVMGNSTAIKLESNFFKVECKPDWCFFHYRVDFKPDETDTRIKKKLLRVHGKHLGAYVFDGSSLYTSNRLMPDPMLLYSMRDTDQEKVELSVRLVGELAPTDIMYLQLLNIIVRKCMEMMKLEEMGRHYYDRHQAIRIDAHHLELWPGFKTALRNHENEILFNVEITHKVLRLDSCLHMINSMRQQRRDEKQITEQLVGSIVMTVYNRKTYRVDDIQWHTSPAHTFEFNGRQVSFIEYFRDKYNLTIRDSRQPMLMSRPKKRDLHRGMKGDILLVPELCQMTGINDEMRANNNLMRALAQHLHTDPSRRVNKLREFINRLRGTPDIQNELQRWGLRFQNRLVDFEGHTIPKESILFGESKKEVPNDRYDWGAAFRDKPLLKAVPLRSWALIVPSREAHAVDKLVNAMQRVSRPLKFDIARPTVRQLSDTRPHEYAKAIDTIMNETQGKMQMLFVILPRQVADIYSAVKKRACLEFGVPSQCFVAKNAHNDKGLLSVCTKLVVQMSAKLGGEPWTVSIPLKKLMIVGFDVYHCAKRKGSSIGAMVATTGDTHARYFSTVSFHSARDELSESMGRDFTKCLMAYKNVNGELPDRIIMYRDGVGDGQLQYVYETELQKIKDAFEGPYTNSGRPAPKFTFIVVTKRINTRMFGVDGRGGYNNPPPGTVGDDVITLPERYDFYLIAQFTRQGTVSPVSYNVLYDRQGLDADKMQRLTFKLCHMYFNWSGTVTVPAPCQYAHKLAYLTGTALGGASHESLSNLLYYL